MALYRPEFQRLCLPSPGWILRQLPAPGRDALPGIVIDRYPEALQFMFHGGNIGKLLVKIA